MWEGSAALCLKENKVLMVLQGKQNEPKRWTIPSGGKFTDETYEACCLRELHEETGYTGSIQEQLYIKKGRSYGVDVTVHYYLVEIIDGEPIIQDPDQLIQEIRWVHIEDLPLLDLSFPEDLKLLDVWVLKYTIS